MCHRAYVEAKGQIWSQLAPSAFMWWVLVIKPSLTGFWNKCFYPQNHLTNSSELYVKKKFFFQAGRWLSRRRDCQEDLRTEVWLTNNTHVTTMGMQYAACNSTAQGIKMGDPRARCLARLAGLPRPEFKVRDPDSVDKVKRGMWHQLLASTFSHAHICTAELAHTYTSAQACIYTHIPVHTHIHAKKKNCNWGSEMFPVISIVM